MINKEQALRKALIDIGDILFMNDFNVGDLIGLVATINVNLAHNINKNTILKIPTHETIDKIAEMAKEGVGYIGTSNAEVIQEFNYQR